MDDFCPIKVSRSATELHSESNLCFDDATEFLGFCNKVSARSIPSLLRLASEF